MISPYEWQEWDLALRVDIAGSTRRMLLRATSQLQFIQYMAENYPDYTPIVMDLMPLAGEEVFGIMEDLFRRHDYLILEEGEQV